MDGCDESANRGYYFSVESQASNIELYLIWDQNDQNEIAKKRPKREFWKEDQHVK